jgi:hypothetical protein
MFDNKPSIDFLEGIDIEANPFRYLRKIRSLDIIFGKKIDDYTVIALPRTFTKKLVRDYERGFCFHIDENLVIQTIEIIVQSDSTKYKPYLAKLPFNLASEMTRKEIQILLGEPNHSSDKKMTTYTVDDRKLDCYFCDDKYNLSNGCLILQYNYYSKKLERVILSDSSTISSLNNCRLNSRGAFP